MTAPEETTRLIPVIGQVGGLRMAINTLNFSATTAAADLQSLVASTKEES